MAAAFPDIEFVNAPYLRDHPAVLDAFCERVAELHEAQPAMNCQLCKYRTQIIGYEHDAGAPQAGHHHHVRGIGVGARRHGDHPTITLPPSMMFDTVHDRRLERRERAAAGPRQHLGVPAWPAGETLVNPPTRHAAKALLADWLAAAL